MATAAAIPKVYIYWDFDQVSDFDASAVKAIRSNLEKWFSLTKHHEACFNSYKTYRVYNDTNATVREALDLAGVRLADIVKGTVTSKICADLFAHLLEIGSSPKAYENVVVIFISGDIALLDYVRILKNRHIKTAVVLPVSATTETRNHFSNFADVVVSWVNMKSSHKSAPVSITSQITTSAVSAPSTPSKKKGKNLEAVDTSVPSVAAGSSTSVTSLTPASVTKSSQKKYRKNFQYALAKCIARGIANPTFDDLRDAFDGDTSKYEPYKISDFVEVMRGTIVPQFTVEGKVIMPSPQLVKSLANMFPEFASIAESQRAPNEVISSIGMKEVSPSKQSNASSDSSGAVSTIFVDDEKKEAQAKFKASPASAASSSFAPINSPIQTQVPTTYDITNPRSASTTPQVSTAPSPSSTPAPAPAPAPVPVPVPAPAPAPVSVSAIPSFSYGNVQPQYTPSPPMMMYQLPHPHFHQGSQYPTQHDMYQQQFQQQPMSLPLSLPLPQPQPQLQDPQQPMPPRPQSQPLPQTQPLPQPQESQSQSPYPHHSLSPQQ